MDINNRKRYTRQEIVNNTFYQMPRFLTAGEFAGSNLSNNARILYTLLLDRHKISIKNAWFDENGEVYIYFKREEMETQLGLSERTVSKVVQELKEFSLVEEKRQGLNKPNKIYLLSPIVGNDENPAPYLDPETDYNPEKDEDYGYIDDTVNSTATNPQDYTPRPAIITSPDSQYYTPRPVNSASADPQYLRPNYNKLINNKNNNNEMSDNEGNKTATAATASKTARGKPPTAADAAATPTNAIPYSQILEMYNALCETKGLRSIRNISGKRKTQTAARLKEYGIDGFKDLFEKVSTSLFLCGGGERGWKADFDWLIDPTNMQKVLEGKYDDDQSNTPSVAIVRHVVSNPHENYRNKNGFNTMETLQQLLDAEAVIDGQVSREGMLVP